ncbi:MAG: carboxypeptidase regulatory-like domain-containing protein [Saprospiraceae bacterium]
MRIVILAFCLSLTSLLWGQGTTSSEMRGTVKDADGEPLIGATVSALHEPSGSIFGSSTNEDGQYQIPGMRVGGPYKVTISYTGYGEQSIENVYLRLGEVFRRDFTLDVANIQLESVMVVASSGVTGQTAGTSTNINAEKIATVPSLNRDISDYLRLSPQANTYSDGISFAGMNNRYNAIYIDGAVNNDVYGLASSGTNGGQTGISPFSIDIIDQFQIVLSPYDVSLGGFAGGGINAVTKSGANKFSGTAYYFTQNESLAGKTNFKLAERISASNPDSVRMKLPAFTKNIYGASLGGPIKKDKIFFFTNVEIEKDDTPIPFEVAQYTSVADRAQIADLDNLKNFLINTYGYDPGGYGNSKDELKGLKLFGKLDFNLGQNNRLSIRHQYTKAEQFDRNSGSTTTINFENNGIHFPSTTNSSAIELHSRLGQNHSNDVIVGYTKVTDDRGTLGSDFPFVIIQDKSNGTIRFGTEEFSTSNLLEQNTLTLTDNFKWYKGEHTFTFGTHNEFYHFNNVFVGQNFGSYTFASLNDFINGVNATSYVRSYSLVDDASGDNTKAAANFNALQLGFYAQDSWTVTPKLTLTGGLRLDIPVITTDPEVDNVFNDTISVFQNAYPVAKDARAGQAPDGQLMFSPRAGFEYDLNGNRHTIIRGGAGIFTSRIPFVWPGAMFTNNGLTIGRVTQSDLGGSAAFISDVNNQYTNPNFAIPSGEVDLFVKDFKYPQVFRTNLAWDQKFGSGFEFSLEGLFTKTLNNIVYTQINSDPTVKFNWTGSPDTRPVYVNKNLVNIYSGGVYLASNTNEGYTYNITASVAKQFGKDFSAYLAYNYGDGKATQEGTSSQNSSQWRGQIGTDGRNFPVLGRTDFAIGHRILTNLTYKHNWTKAITTSLSIFYNGESGETFSYVFAGGSTAQNINGEKGSTSRNRTLIYVPKDQSEINLVDYTAGGVTVTAAEQWSNFNALIESDKGLSSRRGQYSEKNGSFAPFNNVIDLVLRQDLGADLGGDIHKIQLSFDIFNLANLLNKEWGAFYSVPGTPNVDFNNFQILQFEGYDTDGTTPKFTYRQGAKTGKDLFNIGGTSSRWRMRVGLRYMFN